MQQVKSEFTEKVFFLLFTPFGNRFATLVKHLYTSKNIVVPNNTMMVIITE